jgi:hypothetical protein
MEFRSSNVQGFSHFGGDVMSGAHSTRGILLSSNTISPVSDNADETLVLRGKGNGGVTIGASTSIFGGMNRGQTTLTQVDLPVSGLVYSTMSIPGLGVNDMLFIERPGSSAMSTALGMVGYSCTLAGQAQIAFLNNLASTQSIAGDTPVKWAYIKST